MNFFMLIVVILRGFRYIFLTLILRLISSAHLNYIRLIKTIVEDNINLGAILWINIHIKIIKYLQ